MANIFAVLGQTKFKTISNDLWKVSLNSKGIINEITDLKGNKLLGKIGLWIEAETSTNKKYYFLSFIDNKTLQYAGAVDLVNHKTSDTIKWNKVSEINILQTQKHLKNYKNNSYNSPDNIKNWPANGSVNESPVLAPFVDFGHDGKYEYKKGDYPFFKGTHALYSIGNGIDVDATISGLDFYNSAGLEQHLMLYKDTTNKAVKNIFFARMVVHNRSGRNYVKMKSCLLVNFNIGNHKDDYCGTIRNKNTIIGYNADSNDDEYGTAIPTAFVKVLNQKMKFSMYLNSPDNAASNWASSLSELNNFINGKWANGSRITFGGAGIDGKDKESFVFPGNTSNKNKGNWDEASSGLSPSKRTMLVGLPPSILLKDSSWNVEIAIGGKYNVAKPYDDLNDEFKNISQYYGLKTVGITNIDDFELKIYPIPFSDKLVVENAPVNQKITLFDFTGKVIFCSIANGSTLNLSHLKSGFYLLKVGNKLVRLEKI